MEVPIGQVEHGNLALQTQVRKELSRCTLRTRAEQCAKYFLDHVWPGSTHDVCVLWLWGTYSVRAPETCSAAEHMEASFTSDTLH